VGGLSRKTLPTASSSKSCTADIEHGFEVVLQAAECEQLGLVTWAQR
jgi:hypothetical protein